MSRGHLFIVPAICLAACASGPTIIDRTLEGARERAGLVLADEGFGDGASRIVYLDQGWNVPETLWFYHADQGSVFMPYQTFVHLEQADRAEPFIAPAHLAKFRFLNQRKTPNNPDALPVGFARHDDGVGLTCAACHTGQVNYRGTAVRVDGAPALADVTGFFRAAEVALRATLADEEKLRRHAAAVPGGGADPAHVEAAKKTLGETLAWVASYNEANRSSTQEGYGRIDAIGRIINQVIRFTSDPKNSIEPNAPASLPLLWDAPRHDYVQWTAFSPNAKAGSLGRNAGEVIGVFGRVEVKKYTSEDEAKKGYPSTIEADALVSMEESLRGLKSPRWPEDVLPPIDRARAARGASLYQAHCASCHAPIDRDDPRRAVTAIITAVDVVGTDALAADNLVKARAPTGVLEGAISPKGKTYGADESALALLIDLVTRSLAAKPVAAVKAITNAKRHGIEETPKQGNYHQRTDADQAADLRAYKARPLNGVWASSPYLHNGSVPTLHDLLRPAAERPKRFATGRWEFDPRKVGYVSEGEVPFVLDTTVPGNGNGGHEYGTALSEEERWDLVEYLKSL